MYYAVGEKTEMEFIGNNYHILNRCDWRDTVSEGVTAKE
jgi:hypothetical protein